MATKYLFIDHCSPGPRTMVHDRHSKIYLLKINEQTDDLMANESGRTSGSLDTLSTK